MFKWRRSRGKNGSISTLEAIENIGRRDSISTTPTPQKDSPTTNASISLHVQLPNGQTCALSPFTPWSTIRDVKAMIEENTGIKPVRYRLFHEGQLLADESALLDFGIWSSTPLFLVALLEIGLRKPNGQLVPIAVWQSNTVLDLKSRVEERLFIPPEQQVLIKQSGGELGILVVPPADTVHEVKRAITNSLLCFPTKEPLNKSGDNVIEDTCVVSDCGLTWKTVIDLFPLLRMCILKPSGESIPLLASPSNTIWDLKILLEDSLRVDRKDQILTFNGSVLRNARTVEDSGIINDSTISLISVRRLQIIVRHERGPEVARLDAASTDTVLDFKHCIEAATGIPVHQQTLKRQDQIMEDSRCISYYRIAWGSVVHLAPFDFTVSVLLDGHFRRSLSLSVSSMDTVKDIRSIIDSRHSAYLSLCGTEVTSSSTDSAGVLTPGRYDLELGGKTLEDSALLFTCGLSNTSVMRVLPLPDEEGLAEPQKPLQGSAGERKPPATAPAALNDIAAAELSPPRPKMARRPTGPRRVSASFDAGDRQPKPPERRISEIMRDIHLASQANSPATEAPPTVLVAPPPVDVPAPAQVAEAPAPAQVAEVPAVAKASTVTAAIISPPPAWEPPKLAETPAEILARPTRPRAGSSKGPLPQIPVQRAPAPTPALPTVPADVEAPPPVPPVAPTEASPEAPAEKVTPEATTSLPTVAEGQQPFESKPPPFPVPSGSRPFRASVQTPPRRSDAKHKRNLSDVKQDAYPIPGIRRLLAPDTPSPPPPYLDLELDLTGQITDVSPQPTAHGGLCDVYAGEGPGGLKVAMKVLRIRHGHPPAHVKRRIAREVKIWRKLRHPNVLPFHGTFEDGPRIYMVSPWLNNGNVIDHLREHPDTDRHKLLRETVSGLVYLASREPPVIHGDVKAANILIGDNGSAVLSDFGLSILTEALMESSTISELRGASSVRWMAPELLMPERVATLGSREKGRNLKTDVYSIGPLVVELFTGEPPFSDLKNNIHVMLAVVQGERPKRPSRRGEAALRGLDDDLWAIAESCWNDNPALRPTVVDVAFALAQAS